MSRPDAGGRRGPAWLLIGLIIAMIAAILIGLTLISAKSREFAAPGTHNEVWQSYNLRTQIEALIEAAEAVNSGTASAAQLKLRTGVARTALAPLLRSRIFDYLAEPRPEARATLERLDRSTAGWLAALDWRDTARAHQIAADMLEALPPEMAATHDLIVTTNIAVANQLDHERQSLQRIFHWLTGVLILLAIGCLLLALKILGAQRRSRNLGRELHALNESLERRVQSRTRLLHEREALLQAILDSTPSDVTLISADQRRVFYVSDNLLAHIGVERPEQFRLEALFADPADYLVLIERLRHGDSLHQIEARLRPQAPYWALLTARPLQIHGQCAWLIWSLDITRRKTIEHKLQRLAATDSLTGLYNRRALLRAAVKQLRQDRRAPLSVLAVDIDHFKRINDEHGHPVGDQALRGVAQRLTETLRTDALLGRVGGEEFVVVLPGVALADALAVGERLRAAFEDIPLVVDDEDADLALSLTLSIGITQRHERDSLKTLMVRADSALYRAKETGRNRCCVEAASSAADQLSLLTEDS